MSKGTETLSANPTLFDKLREKKSRAVVLLAGAVLSACGGGETTKAVDPAPANTSETPSATASPSVEPVTESTPETPEVNEFGFAELSVDRYTDAESITLGDLEAQKTLFMRNADQDTFWQMFDATKTLGENVQILNAPIDQAYVDMYLVDDWQSRPDLKAATDADIQTHYAVVFAANSVKEDQGEAPYIYEYELLSATEVSNDDEQKVIQYDVIWRDNSSQNSAGDYLNQDMDPGMQHRRQVTWVVEDGAWVKADDKAVQ